MRWILMKGKVSLDYYQGPGNFCKCRVVCTLTFSVV